MALHDQQISVHDQQMSIHDQQMSVHNQQMSVHNQQGWEWVPLNGYGYGYGYLILFLNGYRCGHEYGYGYLKLQDPSSKAIRTKLISHLWGIQTNTTVLSFNSY